MSFIKLYLCSRYKKSIKSINKLTKHINIYKTLIVLPSHFHNNQD